jgi:uncharacterized protein (DUF302 family)
MRIDQRGGIDLPLKVLVWSDAAGKNHLCCKYPAWIAARNGITAENALVIGVMRVVLSGLADGLRSQS